MPKEPLEPHYFWPFWLVVLNIAFGLLLIAVAASNSRAQEQIDLCNRTCSPFQGRLESACECLDPNVGWASPTPHDPEQETDNAP